MTQKVTRNTPIKREILALLAEHHLLSAPQLVEKLHHRGLKANKTSVYRNLAAFMEQNLVCQQSFADEFVYELRHDHHDHVQCDVCGKITEIPCQVRHQSTVNGFEVHHHHLTLFGTCLKCQAKKN